jgi:poly(3-hydroxybutyrate) depolymerase
VKAGGKTGCVGDSYIVRGPPAYTSNSNGLKCIADPNPTTKIDFNVKNPHFCSREDPDSLQKCEPSKCLEKGKVDEDCCAHENEAACADGYIYSKRGNCYGDTIFNTCCTPPPAPGGSTEANNNEGNDDEGNVNEAPTEAPTETPTEAPTAAPLVSGSFKLSNRAYSVSVPVGAGPFPVILLLHGNSGSGSRFLKDISDDLKVLTTTHILVAPDGPGNSWNIVAEKSKEDDALYVGTTLVNHLVEASNVKPEFTLFGHSNGAALTNRILIENDDARIVAAITDVSQLNTHQYHDGNFYIGGSDNSYTTVKSSLTKRKLLQLTGARDNVIPAAGGESPRIPAKTGKLKFLAWEESIYLFAKAYGFTGARDTATDDSTGKIQRVSYPDVHVSASNYKEAGHAVAPGDGNSEVLAFFDREAAPTEAPIEAPTEAPTEEEEEEEEKVPTEAPTETTPTESPTIAPTDAPNEPLTEEPTPAQTSAPTSAPTVAPTKAPTEAPTDAPAPPKMKRRCANWCLRSVRRKQKGWWKTHAGQKAPACHWYKCNGCSPECTTPPSRCVEWCNEPVGTKKRKCEANDGCADCDTIVLNGGVKDTCKTTPTASLR